MRTHSTFSALVLGCLTSFSLFACTVGSGDGTDSTSSDVSFCRPTQIDSNADGVADGLDINCDGVIDFLYGSPSGTGSGSGGGGGSSTHNHCSTMINVNGTTKAITCDGDGSTVSCECRLNGSLVNTCSQAQASCSIGVPNANCCGF